MKDYKVAEEEEEEEEEREIEIEREFAKRPLSLSADNHHPNLSGLF